MEDNNISDEFITEKDKQEVNEIHNILKGIPKVRPSHNDDSLFDEVQYEKNGDDSLEFVSSEWTTLMNRKSSHS